MGKSRQTDDVRRVDDKKATATQEQTGRESESSWILSLGEKPRKPTRNAQGIVGGRGRRERDGGGGLVGEDRVVGNCLARKIAGELIDKRELEDRRRRNDWIEGDMMGQRRTEL